MKKKILSLTLACLMIMTVIVTTVPVYAGNAICKIGDTEYTSLDNAITAIKDSGVAGQTIELLTDIEVEKINTGRFNIPKFTIKSATALGRNATLTVKSDSIVSGGAAYASLINFENIDFVQPTTSTNAIVHARGGSVYTFNNCTFKVGGYSASMGAHFVANSSSGTITMNNCTVNYVGTDTTNVMFASYNDNYKYTLNLNNVTVNTGSVAKTMFRLCSKMTVNIDGATSLSNNGGTMFDLTKGGTVNVLNGQAYGGYAAPEMVDGASVRTNTDSNGLRFTANFAKENTATSYGMLVTLASNLTNTAFTAAALEAAGVKTYAAVPANIVADDGSFTTALLGIADVNAQYAARGYAIYETENATITVYSAYNADKNCRSLAWVADAATKDVKTEKNQTTGHIFEVETGVFSRYSKDQYEVVKAYAAQYNG